MKKGNFLVITTVVIFSILFLGNISSCNSTLPLNFTGTYESVTQVLIISSTSYINIQLNQSSSYISGKINIAGTPDNFNGLEGTAEWNIIDLYGEFIDPQNNSIVYNITISGEGFDNNNDNTADQLNLKSVVETFENGQKISETSTTFTAVALN